MDVRRGADIDGVAVELVAFSVAVVVDLVLASCCCCFW